MLDKVLEEYGEDVIIREYPEGVPSISTGSLAIDVSTGIGGIPKGRFTEVYGPEGSGKTTLLLNIAREAVNTGERVLFIDTENSLDYAYAEEIVGNMDSEIFLIIQPESAESSFTIAMMGIEAGYTCILFDSVAALSPEKELEKGMEKQQIGLAPRLTSKFLRKVVHTIRKKEVAFIYSNQVRANIGSYFGGYTTPAGYALKHYTSLRIYFSKGKDIEDSDKNAIGNFVNFVIKKNKVGRPFRQATTNIIYGVGINYYRDVISFGTLLGIIKNRGSYFAYEDETIGSKPGVANTIEALADDPALLDNIVEMCYNVVGSQRNQKGVVSDTNGDTSE